MKLLSLAGMILLAGTMACSQAGTPSLAGTPIIASSTQAPSTCGDPHAHVYNPNRLQLLAPCVTVKGIITLIRLEPDGDDHIRLRVDTDQRDPHGGHWTNARNDVAQAGDLVLEPVCEHTVTQADAVSACASYQNPLTILPVGTHVVATGTWVLDQSPNHGWLELHPLSSLQVIS